MGRQSEPGTGGPGLSRRGFLGRGAALGGALAVGAMGGAAVGRQVGSGRSESKSQSDLGQERVPFYGARQAGIETPLQAHAAFVALDVAAGVGRQDLVRLMKLWTDDAVRLMDGRPALADPGPELAGVPARLTITVGLGRGALRAAGLSDQLPEWLGPLPNFRGDQLQWRWSGGDLLLVIAAEDPMTVSHAVRVLSGDASRFATVRWTQRGFHRPANTAPTGITGRNLMGQVDGTVNPTAGSADFAEIVWHPGPGWLAGGTGLVVRRIAMNLSTWGALDQQAKEQAVGRRLADGAPLTGGGEFAAVDFDAVDADGIPVIASNAHIRLAHGTSNSARILRRPFNYDDGFLGGRPDAGLIFAAYCADIATQYVPMQRRLAESDVLNLWTTAIGSAVFAVPAGVPAPGDFFAQTLLG